MLVDIAREPGEIEGLKATIGYGLPKSYPVAVFRRDDDYVAGVSGIGDDPPNVVKFEESDKSWVNDRLKRVRKEAKNARFLQLLEDAVKDKRWPDAKGMIMYYFQHPEFRYPEPNPVAFAPAYRGGGMSTASRQSSGKRRIAGFGDLGCGPNCNCKSGMGAEAAQAVMNATMSAGTAAVAAPPQGNFAQNFNTVNSAVQNWATQLAPMFARKPRDRVVVTQAPDYTTIAMVAGGVLAVGLLASAIARKRK